MTKSKNIFMVITFLPLIFVAFCISAWAAEVVVYSEGFEADDGEYIIAPAPGAI